MSAMAASKSLSKTLPGKALAAFPVPSNLNWFTP
jgi:hypothetical protein